MTVTTKGIVPTRAKLQAIETFLKSSKPIKNITEGVKKEVLRKTGRGKDYMGRKFKAYSPGYAKKKGSSLVNLKDTGRMLGALATKLISNLHGRVYIRLRGYPKKKIHTEHVANVHTTGTGGKPKREFMGISKSALKKLVKLHYNDNIIKIIGQRFGK